MNSLSVELVGEIALLSDLAFGAGERVVLGENGDGSRELLEEVGLALRHLLDEGLGALVGRQLVIDKHQALVVKDVAVVVVVQDHRRSTIVSHVLHRLGIRDHVRALVQHVLDVVRVQGGVHLRVQTVDQLHAVGPPHAVGPCMHARVGFGVHMSVKAKL